MTSIPLLPPISLPEIPGLADLSSWGSRPGEDFSLVISSRFLKPAHPRCFWCLLCFVLLTMWVAAASPLKDLSLK